MTIRVAINGYGRIGRNILRAHYEYNKHPDIQIVAINDLGDVNTNAYLTRYDTTHGKFPGEVSVEGNDLIVNGDKIRVVAERDPKKLPWKELNIDIVFECTLFTSSIEAGRLNSHVKSTNDTLIVGTRTENPSNFPFNSGNTKPTAAAAPVFVGIIDWVAERARRKSLWYTSSKL